MNIHTRRRLFYGFCIAFLVIGTSTVLYTQGWRVDFANWSIKKVGGIFVRSFPREASIFLDGISIGNASWFLRNGTFINNLFPKTYELTLEAPGFRSWTRHIPVAPAFVYEISNAVLVPSLPLIPPSSTLPISLPRSFAPSFPSHIATSSRFTAEIKNNARSSSTVLISEITSPTSSIELIFSHPLFHVQWSGRGTLGILEQSGALWEYDLTSKTQEKIADDVRYFAWNTDGTKIAALEQRSFEVFDRLNPQEGYRRFNIPAIQEAERVLWYKDDLHLFLIFPSRTLFLDLNDANLENLTEVVSTHKVFYNPNLNILYYQDSATSTIQALQFPR
ncbi:MAG: PEGA domain-containing protein [Candidatus Liptonbacteria bacterium]|nr:PEGA domain-containing protein [Candidatus Liptonbacteria bacterium]